MLHALALATVSPALHSGVGDAVVLTAAFVTLLIVEWRYRRAILRVGTTLLALLVLAWYQPNYTGARRRALGAPHAERVKTIGVPPDTVSAYASGVYTTMETVGEASQFGAPSRLAAIGALVWLACSPARRSSCNSAIGRTVHRNGSLDAPEA